MLTPTEAGQAGQGVADDAVLAFAHALGRAVLTHNRKHFRNGDSAGHAHSGLVWCTEDADFASLKNRINVALAGAGDPSGQLIRKPLVRRPDGRTRTPSQSRQGVAEQTPPLSDSVAVGLVVRVRAEPDLRVHLLPFTVAVILSLHEVCAYRPPHQWVTIGSPCYGPSLPYTRAG